MSRVRYGLLLVALFVVACGAWQVGALVRRVGRDEHEACLIQDRQLPAGHQLAAIMRDIHALLTVPPSPDSPPTPRNVRPVLASLDGHLGSYLALEAEQPAHRNC